MARIQNLLTMPVEGASGASFAEGMNAALGEMERRDAVRKEAALKNRAMDLSEKKAADAQALAERQMVVEEAKAAHNIEVKNEQLRQQQVQADAQARQREQNSVMFDAVLSGAAARMGGLTEGQREDVGRIERLVPRLGPAQLQELRNTWIDPDLGSAEKMGLVDQMEAGVLKAENETRRNNLRRSLDLGQAAGWIDRAGFLEQYEGVDLSDPDFPIDQALAHFDEIQRSHATIAQYEVDRAHSQELLQSFRQGADSRYSALKPEHQERFNAIQQRLLYDVNLTDADRRAMHGEVLGLMYPEIEEHQAAQQAERDRVQKYETRQAAGEALIRAQQQAFDRVATYIDERTYEGSIDDVAAGMWTDINDLPATAGPNQEQRQALMEKYRAKAAAAQDGEELDRVRAEYEQARIDQLSHEDLPTQHKVSVAVGQALGRLNPTGAAPEELAATFEYLRQSQSYPVYDEHGQQVDVRQGWTPMPEGLSDEERAAWPPDPVGAAVSGLVFEQTGVWLHPNAKEIADIVGSSTASVWTENDSEGTENDSKQGTAGARMPLIGTKAIGL